jgi:diguanylate cyclase (GGDEF)-like protein
VRLRAEEAYAAAVVAVGAGALALTTPKALPMSPVGLGFFAALAAAAELLPVPAAGGQVSLAPAVVFPAYLVLGPGAAAWCLAFGTAVSSARSRRPPLVIGFNAAQYALSVLAAGAVVAWVRGRPFAQPPGIAHIPVVLFLPTFVLVNHLLVDVYSSLALRVPLRAVWWDPLKLEASWAMLSVPVGYFVALVYLRVGPVIALGLFPSFVVAAFFMRLAANAARQHRELASLLALSQALGRAADPEAVAAAAEHLAGAFLASPIEVHAGRLCDGSRLGAALPDVARRARERSPLTCDTLELPPPFRSLVAVAIPGPLEPQGLVLALFRYVAPDPQEIRYVEAVAVQVGLALEGLRLRREVERLAVTDPLLPQLYNYRHLRRTLEGLTDDPDTAPLSLAYFDLDGFKDLNDRFGHLAGDEALRAAARRLLASVRGGDLVFRYAGDEFVLLMPRTGEAEAATVVERIRRRMAEAPLLDGAGPTTISVGVATYRQGESWQEFLHRADERMLEEKARRRRPVR